MSQDSKDEESNQIKILHDKKKKKKKKRHNYSALNDSQHPYFDKSFFSDASEIITNNANTNENKKEKKKKRKKVYIEEERNILNDEENELPHNLNFLTDDKIIKEKKKKKKKDKERYNNKEIEIERRKRHSFDEEIENYLAGVHSFSLDEPTNRNEFIDRINRNLGITLKEPVECNSVHIQNKMEEEKETSNSNENENRNQSISQEELNVEETTESPRYNNVFTMLFHKIKKKIIERKGNPIVNENLEEDELRELRERGSRISVEENVDEENRMHRSSIDYTGNYPNNDQEISNNDNDIIHIMEVNPNDMIQNEIHGRIDQIEKRDINVIHTNIERTNQEESSSHVDENEIRTPNWFQRRITLPIKNYISELKEKIKKYWMERVEEANIQINTPHANTLRRNRNVPNTTTTNDESSNNNTNTIDENNTTSVEDENDDPTCPQILFFFGLICKFPFLWIIGSFIFCITPSEHKKTKRWSLINSVFAFISIVYLIVTARMKLRTPSFSVIMNDTIEQRNYYRRGTIKNYGNFLNSFIIHDQTNYSWICYQNIEAKCTTGQSVFLDWNFLKTQKPTRNIILSNEIYTVINRIQVTVVFGKGNKYPNEQVQKISHFFKDLKKDMDPIPFEKINISDKDIPDNFFGSGLRCERRIIKEKDKDNEREIEKWYLFWKVSEDINMVNNSMTNPSFPVGEVFLFKHEYNCQVAFIYPKNLNLNENKMPDQFVEIKRIIIKSF